jgi:hypothetical protein
VNGCGQAARYRVSDCRLELQHKRLRGMPIITNESALDSSEQAVTLDYDEIV